MRVVTILSDYDDEMYLDLPVEEESAIVVASKKGRRCGPEKREKNRGLGVPEASDLLDKDYFSRH